MSPPNDTVLRRRHWALVLLRTAAAALMAYGAVLTIRNAVYAVIVISGGAPPMTFVGDAATPLMSHIVPGLLLAVFSRPLSRWLVPPGLRGDTCPQCGYSLKQLKSPICPECGADVRGITRAGVREGATP